MRGRAHLESREFRLSKHSSCEVRLVQAHPPHSSRGWARPAQRIEKTYCCGTKRGRESRAKREILCEEAGVEGQSRGAKEEERLSRKGDEEQRRRVSGEEEVRSTGRDETS